jgi:two-component system CheB/CheR fusion protein
VQDVLRKLVSIDTEVSTDDGRCIKVRIMPYRTMDKMIDGVVITCVDTTDVKNSENELLAKIARLEAQIAG